MWRDSMAVQYEWRKQNKQTHRDQLNRTGRDTSRQRNTLKKTIKKIKNKKNIQEDWLAFPEVHKNGGKK